MKLDFILVKKDYPKYNKVKYLFERAFPPIERPSFNMLMSLSHHEMYAVEDKGEFIGLIDLLKYQDILYIFFLAIKKTKRGKGYGSNILKYVNEKYNKNYRIYLMAENPDIECTNKEERISRINFYKRNGFKLSETVVIEFEVNYRILYLSNEVSKKEFIESMKYLLGEASFNKYYVHNVR